MRDRLHDDGIDQGAAETKAAPPGRDIEPLHLAASVGLYRPKPDTSQRLAMIVAREEQFAGRGRVFAGQTGQFRREILVSEIDAERGGVGVEQARGRREIGGRSDGFDREGGVRHGASVTLGGWCDNAWLAGVANGRVWRGIMTADAKLVAVRIPKISPVIVGMVVWPEAGRPLIGGSVRHGDGMAGIDGVPAGREQGDHLAVARRGAVTVKGPSDQE